MNLNQMIEALTSPPLKKFEPCLGDDPYCPCQDGDLCHYKAGEDGTKAMEIPE